MGTHARGVTCVKNSIIGLAGHSIVNGICICFSTCSYCLRLGWEYKLYSFCNYFIIVMATQVYIRICQPGISIVNENWKCQIYNRNGKIVTKRKTSEGFYTSKGVNIFFHLHANKQTPSSKFTYTLTVARAYGHQLQ